MNIKDTIIAISFCSMGIVGCDSGPKVIPSEAQEKASPTSGIFSESDGHEGHNHEAGAVNKDVHTVIVEEVLPTEKYVYMHVKEGEEIYWIAAGKQEIKVGGTYFFTDGLLKTNFESKEYGRVFDKLYLVSKIVPAGHGGEEEIGEVNHAEVVPVKIVHKEGSIKIADLVKNPKKYEGKEVQISGQCVKVNPNIMNRNWLHFIDGTKDEYDLVITSDAQLPEGHAVTMKGTVALNKDFGAGYKYDILIENGVIVQ